MTEALLLLLAPLGTYWAGRRLIIFYKARQAVKPNYRGKSVAPALGPALLLSHLMVAAANLWLGNDMAPWIPLTLLLLGSSFYGLWDDFMEESVSGFAGHLGAGLKGNLSAGLLKVITAVPVAFLFTGTLPLPLPLRVVAVLAVLFSANGINLLDRRPGRALKIFFLVGLLLIFAAKSALEAARMLLPLMAAAVALAPLDLLAEGMLGDCGANLLGAALGAAAALSLEPPALLLFAAAWGALNIVSERVSLSAVIDKNRLLSFLDALGRSEEEKLT